MSNNPTPIDLQKLAKHSKLLHAIIADLKGLGHKDKDIFVNDDGSYSVSAGDFREIAKDFLDMGRAINDCIRRPLGVVPDSAMPFYDQDYREES